MVSIYGNSFIYDSVPSEMYNLRILSFDTGESDGTAMGEAEIFEKYIYRKSRAYYYGKSQNKPLEFDITVGSFDTIPASNRSLISKWLLGRNKYLPFQIMQDDLADVIFNVIFTNSSLKFIGNYQKAFTLHGRCDAPWGFTYPQTFTYPASGVLAGTLVKTFDFFNDSADSDYLYPTIQFTMNASGNSMSLTNNTDNSRLFYFSGLSTGETITVDNYNQIITTSKADTYRLANFNKNWFRLLPGHNSYTISAAISQFKMTYSFARKVGM